MHKQQLIEEYEYICKRLENDRLLSAQHSLFRPKPAITEPFAKRQWVEEPSSQPATVSATSVSATVVSAAPDTSSLGASTFSVESQAKPVSAAPRFTNSTVITTAAMDSTVTRRKVGVSPFADYAAVASPFLSSIAAGPTPSNVFDVSVAPTVYAPRFCVADQIPVGVLFESTPMNLQEFFLDSDEEMPPGVSRVTAEPDSDDAVVAEILFRGQSICGDKELLPHVYPHDIQALRRKMNRHFRLNPDADDGLDLWRDLDVVHEEHSSCSGLDKREDCVHVYGFFISYSAMLLERMLRHRLTVPPSYCRHVRVGGIVVGTMAGTIIRTVQADLLYATMPVSSAPMS
uniref:Uncharacterized protein n=1 Tax=Tanacetum cinerariifolium TaxID=118510 RepID=A0A6L2L3Z0_TANCI|nr:hypothetical protein [Tanacetum cinerariifolium]